MCRLIEIVKESYRECEFVCMICEGKRQIVGQSVWVCV